jgi:hydrogenase maturation protease
MNDPLAIVIGIGNEMRGDDGAGPVVARRIGEANLPRVKVHTLHGDGAAIMDAFDRAAAVFLIDAVSSGSPPGTIHRIDAGSRTLPTEFFHYSSHAFGLAEAVEMARVLGRLPPATIVFGIEGGSFASGEGLTPAVAEAARNVAETLLREVEEACRIDTDEGASGDRSEDSRPEDRSPSP